MPNLMSSCLPAVKAVARSRKTNKLIRDDDGGEKEKLSLAIKIEN